MNTISFPLWKMPTSSFIPSQSSMEIFKSKTQKCFFFLAFPFLQSFSNRLKYHCKKLWVFHFIFPLLMQMLSPFPNRYLTPASKTALPFYLLHDLREYSFHPPLLSKNLFTHSVFWKTRDSSSHPTFFFLLIKASLKLYDLRNHCCLLNVICKVHPNSTNGYRLSSSLRLHQRCTVWEFMNRYVHAWIPK